MSVMTFVVRLLLIGVIAAAVGLAALFLSRSQPTRYGAQAKLAFSADQRPELQVLGAPFVRPSTDARTFTATNADLVDSHTVADRLARKQPQLGLTADQIAGRVSARPLPNTSIVQLNATGDTPAKAEQLARAYVDEFTNWFADRQRRRARTVQRVVRQRYESLTRQQRTSGTGSSLRDQLAALEVLAAVGSGSPDVIEGAHASARAKEPQTRRNVTFGIIFGLALGVGLVALRAELKRRPGPGPDERLAPDPDGVRGEDSRYEAIERVAR
ncbi:MAG TPA: hypothetical protein VH834_25205 [Solirubrobacteraceae bacterium]|jgi:capsular polysaccharide biosynthesis protein